ncbi:MAG: phenylacetic acid degradation protein PaaY [Metallibacterium scheffleri]|jgi:phenylacetic acid degradation protein|nr:phenylacetic acid degradation protein PaaY [Metallibacterium scheffleri]
MPCYSIDGVVPVVHATAYVHPSAVLIGDVVVGAGCYVGPCASLRGDFGRIVLHEGSNLQDCCVMHGFPGHDTVVHAGGHIGHGAVLHSCIVHRDALVGMNAVVMDDAEVGEQAIVAACAFVPAAMVIPPRTLVAGVPARIKRALTEQEMAWKAGGTRTYQELAVRSLQTLREVEPLRELPQQRAQLRAPKVQPLVALRGKDKD